MKCGGWKSHFQAYKKPERFFPSTYHRKLFEGKYMRLKWNRRKYSAPPPPPPPKNCIPRGKPAKPCRESWAADRRVGRPAQPEQEGWAPGAVFLRQRIWIETNDMMDSLLVNYIFNCLLIAFKRKREKEKLEIPGGKCFWEKNVKSIIT